ncbi:hypothetical protein BKA57DRAFT_465685, partial [Linnemannia elongata]
MNPPPPFCTSFLFSFLLSSFFSLTSLSIVLLVTHLVSFLIPTFTRNYPPRTLSFITHVTTSPSSFFSSPSHFFFSLYYSSPSRSMFLFPVYLLITYTFLSWESTFLLPSAF